MISKIKVFLYFLCVGWIIWIVEQLKEKAKLKQEVLIDGYDLKKKDIEDATNNDDINKLVSDTNKLYKSGGSGSAGNGNSGQAS